MIFLNKEDAIKLNQICLNDGKDEIHAYYVSKYKTNTIALGREVTSLPIAELYVEGGAC